MCEENITEDTSEDTTEINPECPDDDDPVRIDTTPESRGAPQPAVDYCRSPPAIHPARPGASGIPGAEKINISGTGHHPGAYLRELLIWHSISADDLARKTEIPRRTIAELTATRRPVDRRISQGLAAYFGNSAQFWLDLQERFDRG